jgi:hypothetical protein
LGEGGIFQNYQILHIGIALSQMSRIPNNKHVQFWDNRSNIVDATPVPF